MFSAFFFFLLIVVLCFCTVSVTVELFGFFFQNLSKTMILVSHPTSVFRLFSMCELSGPTLNALTHRFNTDFRDDPGGLRTKTTFLCDYQALMPL